MYFLPIAVALELILNSFLILSDYDFKTWQPISKTNTPSFQLSNAYTNIMLSYTVKQASNFVEGY